MLACDKVGFENEVYNNIPIILINELLSRQYIMEIREELNTIGVEKVITLLDLL